MHKIRKQKRGAVAPLVAIMIVPLLAMVAFCVDIGYVVRVKAELQHAADAAALAGAAKLMTPLFSGIQNVNALASANITGARAEAKTFAALNTAGNTSLQLLDGDIVVGYMASPTDQQATLSAWSAGTQLPNTVQVLVRRDSTANTPVGLFFSRVLGINNVNCTSTATAAFLQRSNITGFSGANGRLLPIAIDVNYWNSFLTTGRSPDGTLNDAYRANLPTSTSPAPNNVSNGADNIPEFNNVYPDKTSPGNFGLVSIGPPASDTVTYQGWIDNGPSASDLSYFGPNGLQATPSAPVTVSGGPGMKGTLISDLQGAIGQPRVVPLFSSYANQGSTTSYTIIGFAGITIVSATGHGSNIQIVVQPQIVVDTSATGGSGGNSSSVYSTTPLSLTR